jgi:curved DNA-binding protein CbpA
MKKAQKSKSRSKSKKEKKPQIEEEDSKEDLSSENNPQSPNLYSLLGVEKTATNAEIRKAYRRLVFVYHPDKNKTDPDAGAKFANIARAYKILSNPDSRKIYDDTGDYDDEDEGKINIMETLNYFRKIHNPKDIDSFKKKYLNSKEEEEDLINFYKSNDGDIKKILEWIPFSKNEDVPRYIKIYEKLFKNKTLTKNKKFEESKDKVQLLKEDAEEAKEAAQEMEKLTKAIMGKKRKRNYNEYLDNLKERYAKDEDDNGEIDDDEFEKIKSTIGKKGKEKKGKSKSKSKSKGKKK